MTYSVKCKVAAEGGEEADAISSLVFLNEREKEEQRR